MKTTRQKEMIKHLINGGLLSIKNAFTNFGVSNISREVIRLIEQPAEVVLRRKKMTAKTRYGSSCYWFVYYADYKTKQKLKSFLKKLK